MEYIFTHDTIPGTYDYMFTTGTETKSHVPLFRNFSPFSEHTQLHVKSLHNINHKQKTNSREGKQEPQFEI